MEGFCMKLMLFLLVSIMFILTKRYNEYDFFENRWLDLLLQVFYIFTIIIIFFFITSNNAPLISLYCAYVLHKNINWFMTAFNDDYEYSDKENNNEDNEDENNENSTKNN